MVEFDNMEGLVDVSRLNGVPQLHHSIKIEESGSGSAAVVLV